MKMIDQDIRKMKLNKPWYTWVVLLLLPLFLLTSCKKNDNKEQFNKGQPTLFNYIGSNKNLSLYQAALKRAGMYNAETFSSGGPFTVFAPVDSAFTNVGLTLDSINRYDPQALASVLKYAIIYGKISGASLVGFYAQDMFSLNATYKPNLTKNYYGIFFDGIPLINGGSVDLNDGVLHEVGRMPLPPINDIFSIISKTENLTLMTAVIKKLGLITKYTTAFPNNNGYYTLFAPTDDAFKKFGYPDIASIENADPTVLQNVFYSLTLDGGARRFTSGFKGGYDIRGQYLYVQTDGFTIISTGNTLPTHIIRPDILATNGIIQVVDQVIAVVIR